MPGCCYSEQALTDNKELRHFGAGVFLFGGGDAVGVEQRAEIAAEGVGNVPVRYEDGCACITLGKKSPSIYYLIQGE